MRWKFLDVSKKLNQMQIMNHSDDYQKTNGIN